MAKRNTKSSTTQQGDVNFGPIANKVLPERYRLKCQNEAQKEYARIITDHEITVAYGPAGTGKSFIAIARAIELLQNVSNNYSRIIISKPAVEADEKLGFMPGTEREKLEPHISSALDIFDKIVGKYNLKYKYSADYDYFYRMIVKHKLKGVSTKKKELFGIFKSGGFSSRVRFIDHLLECNKIRLDNNQNIIIVLIIFFIKLIYNFKKLFKN